MRKVVEWIVAHPRTVVLIVVAITLGFAAAIPKITTLTDFKEYLSRDDPAVKAMDRAEDRYGSQTFFSVSVVAPDTIFKVSTLEKIKALREEFEKIIGVDEVNDPLNSQVITGKEEALVVSKAAPKGEVPQTPEALEEYKERVLGSRMLRDHIISSDGKAGVISLKLKKDADQTAVARQVVEIVERYKDGPERIYIVGLPYMSLVLSETMGRDLRVMLPIVIFVVIVVLYLSFFSLRGVLLPLLVVSLSTVWAVGAMAALRVPFTIMSFIMPVILMAIGIAYAIHVLNKYYEELAAGKGKREALIETALLMVSPVAMAGLTTVAGFLSLMNSFLIPQRQFGLFTAFGVLVAMLLSLALLPALLALLPVPRRKMELRTGTLGKGLALIGRLVTRQRKAVLIASLAVFIAFAIGTAMVRVETSQTEFLGQDHPIVQALNVMDEHFSGSEQVIVEFDTGRRDGLKDPELLKRIVAFEDWLGAKEGVKINKTISLADLVREMNQKFHADDPSYYVIPDDRKLVAQLLLLFTFQGGELGNMARGDFSAGEVIGLYHSAGSTERVELAREVQQYLDANFKDLRAEMVGPTRVSASLFSRIIASQITSLLTSIIASGLIVSLLMGSLISGLISLIPLVLTVMINFGLMGFSNTPLDMATLMVSSIAIGIGIDYAIHFMSRFRLEYREGRDPKQALTATIQTTGRGIAYNALALALGFAVLLFSTFKGTTNFGLLIALTMIIGATSAFTIIPAILITWEPEFLTRRAWSRKGVRLERARRPILGLNPDPDLTQTDKKEVQDESEA
ncbi:MAG: efflux RND transporter permease subunit [Candidatus Bipolaricaulia bacterium]